MRPTLANDNRSDVLNTDNAYYFSSTSSNLGEHGPNRLDALSSTTSSRHPQFNVDHQQQQQPLSGPGVVDPRYNKYANDLMLGMYQSGGVPAKLQGQQHDSQQQPSLSFAGPLGEQEGKVNYIMSMDGGVCVGLYH